MDGWRSGQSHLEEVVITYPRFILIEQMKVHEATGDLTILVTAIQGGFKAISNKIKKSTTFQNDFSSPPQQLFQKLVQFATMTLVNSIKKTKTACIIATSNMAKTYIADPESKAKYVVVLNPLLGIENIDNTGPLGSIFGIYRRSGVSLSWRDALQAGNKLFAAGYAVYHHITTFIMRIGKMEGVKEFILDDMLGEFIVWSQDLRIPKKGHIYSINEGLIETWDVPTYEYIRRKKDYRLGRVSKAFNTGCALADIHHIIKVGGIYINPTTCDPKHKTMSLVFFANPISYIVRSVGGFAFSDLTSVLFMEPKEFKQRVPFCAGSPDDIIDLIETTITIRAKEQNK